MSWGPEEKRLFASRPVRERLREGISLLHPGFEGPHHLTAERTGWAADDGEGRSLFYRPALFDVADPSQGESGLAEVPIQMAVDREVCEALARAIKRSDAPLGLIVRSYRLDGTTPKRVLSVELTALEARPHDQIIAGVASGPRWDAMAFPRRVGRVHEFPGLR